MRCAALTCSVCLSCFLVCLRVRWTTSVFPAVRPSERSRNCSEPLGPPSCCVFCDEVLVSSGVSMCLVCQWVVVVWLCGPLSASRLDFLVPRAVELRWPSTQFPRSAAAQDL